MSLAMAAPPRQVLAASRSSDPAQGERGRVVPKRDPLERAQGVACLECPRCRRDERIHAAFYAAFGAPPNPVTVVTPCSLCAEAKLCVVDKNCRFGQTSKENGDGGYSASSRNQIVPG